MIRTIAFLTGVIVILGVITVDIWYLGRGLVDEGSPEFSTVYIVRSIVILISTFVMLYSLVDVSRPKLTLDDVNRIPAQQYCILLVIALSSLFLFLFIYQPSTFNSLSLEDGLVEWASALLFLGSSVIVLGTFLMSRSASNTPKGTKLSLIILSLIFFVIGMEELSWLQRVFNIQTPEILGGRAQLNVHNFATNQFENVYYFSAFLFLVILPFLRLFFSFIASNTYLRLFVPRPFIAIIGAFACAYNYDMWNVIFTQITFFGSVAILLAFSMSSSNTNDKVGILFVLLLIIATQILFLFNGVNFERRWEVTEYKEFFIPLAFLMYAFDLFVQISATLQKTDHAD